MPGCEEHRATLSRLHDGEASAEELRGALAHASSCASCGEDASLLDAVGARLRERARLVGAGVPADAGAPPGLRDAVLARLHRGDAVVLEIHPFLRRFAAAAAVVFVTATASAFWQASSHRPSPAREAGVPRAEILAELGRPRPGPGR